MIDYRIAAEKDLPAICALGEEVNEIHHAAYPHVFAPAGGPDRDLKHWEASLGKSDSRIFVAESQGRVVGFANVAMVDEAHSLLQPLRFGRVGSVSVIKEMRGRGIGRELMKLVHEFVGSHGGYEVRLNVWAFNEPARSLYAELGYEVRSLSLAHVLPVTGRRDR